MTSHTLPDILAPNLKVVFCGLNPGLGAAIAGHHFLSPSNRFWRVLHEAGFTSHLISPHEDRSILDYGCGLTTAVSRATVKASEVSRDEFRKSSDVLLRKLEKYRPTYIAFLGKAAYLEISGLRDLEWGAQSTKLAGSKVWILPNPSGLNRSFSMEKLVQCYGELRRAYGRTH